MARGPDGRVPARSPGPRFAPGRRISAALVGGLWWWAAVRLALWPHSAGPVEGAVVMGGWGLSLLPVHCVPWAGRRERAKRGPGADRGRITRAWRRRCWGGGSGRS
nr:hypothetical protein [Streptomyces sp. GS7]